MYKVIFFSLAILLMGTHESFALSIDQKIETAKERCSVQNPLDPILYWDNFYFGQTFEEMDRLYNETYSSPARLQNRVGYVKSKNSFISQNHSIKSESVTFPEHYIKAIILQVENALRLKYVDFVFFPDMGHSHLYIPLDHYTEHIEPIPGSVYKSIEASFSSPGLKTLYHTAEQLQMLDENHMPLPGRKLQWRFYTRNPVGDLNGKIEIHQNLESPGNTMADDLEGYRYFTGFNISANKNGCFPFEDQTGQIQYFDLSAWDLAYNPVHDAEEDVDF